MKNMTKQNLQNIRCRFEEMTGTDLNPSHRTGYLPFRKTWVLAAAIVACLAMAAFTYPLFSSLDGDELSLSGLILAMVLCLFMWKTGRTSHWNFSRRQS